MSNIRKIRSPPKQISTPYFRSLQTNGAHFRKHTETLILRKTAKLLHMNFNIFCITGVSKQANKNLKRSTPSLTMIKMVSFLITIFKIQSAKLYSHKKIYTFVRKTYKKKSRSDRASKINASRSPTDSHHSAFNTINRTSKTVSNYL